MTLVWSSVTCLVDPVAVTVTVDSTTSLRVSWAEPASISSQHLPTDTYTVALTPSCKDGSAVDTPTPQSVLYDASPIVQFSDLGRQYIKLAKSALICVGELQSLMCPTMSVWMLLFVKLHSYYMNKRTLQHQVGTPAQPTCMRTYMCTYF